MKKENIIIFINSCNKIIDIFLGPFLVAYFIKISADSLIDLSTYNILNNFFLAIFGCIAGYLVEKNCGLTTFRTGVILRFLYILLIILLKDDLINHIGLIAFMGGVSAITFWFPFNLYNIYSVENDKRTIFEANKKNISSIIAIIMPITLGTIITTTNYRMTAIIILAISFLEIVSSFYLKPLPKFKFNYSLINMIKQLKNNDEGRKILIMELFAGICISSSAISTIITIFIIESFKTDLHLGTINSISAIITLLFIYAYSRYFKSNENNKIIFFSIFLVLTSSIILFIFETPITVIIYNVIYEMFALGILSLIESIKLNKFNHDKIDKEYINEYMAIREIVLNTGRIIGYMLLIIATVIGINYLKYSFLILNIMLILLGLIMTKIKQN